MGAATWRDVPIRRYQAALQRAREAGDAPAAAYLRVVLAAIGGTGVRLSAEEAAHLANDHAIGEAAANLACEEGA